MDKMKKINKIVRILLVIGLLYVATDMSFDISAATVSDSASDNTTGTANGLNMGDTASGSITETDDLDYYRFQLTSAGCITLNITSYMQYYCIKLFDSNGEEIWYTDFNEWTESVGFRRDTYSVYLEKGIYYMEINGYKYGTSYKSTGKYECKTSFVSSGVNNIESDNSFSTANNVLLGNTIIGQISENDDYDIYKFTLSNVGCVTLDMTSYMQYYCIKLFDSNGEEIWYTDFNEWTESVGYRRDTYNVYLEKGTYYIEINGYKYSSSYKSTGKYVVGTKFLSSSVSFDGDDNSFNAAKSISKNVSYKGQISINDDFDTYKFVLSSKRYVVVNLTSYMEYYCIKIFNSVGEEIWYTDYNEWNREVSYRKDTYNVELSAGTYYIQINGYKYGTNYKSTGKYTFSVADLNQSNCQHEYKETTVSPTYLNRGYTLHKCSKCGKSYKDNYTAKRTLSQGYIWSYGMQPGKRKIKVSYQGISDVSGYQLRYSRDRKFKKAVKIVKAGKGKTTKTIKNLKNKKRYYVQVRGYKKVKGKVVYGKWSAKRNAKTN